jgi:hypothetical protein
MLHMLLKILNSNGEYLRINRLSVTRHDKVSQSHNEYVFDVGVLSTFERGWS